MKSCYSRIFSDQHFNWPNPKMVFDFMCLTFSQTFLHIFSQLFWHGSCVECPFVRGERMPEWWIFLLKLVFQMPMGFHKLRTILGFYFLCPTALSICQGSSKPRDHITAVNLKKQAQETWPEENKTMKSFLEIRIQHTVIYT